MRRPLAWALALSTLLAAPAEAFRSQPFGAEHRAITERALDGFGLRRDAMARIVDGNIRADWDEMTLRLWPGSALVVPNGRYVAAHHFDRSPGVSDNEAFAAGVRYLQAERVAVAGLLRDGQDEAALVRLGRSVHTVQDFYSHSNAIDLPPDVRHQVLKTLMTGEGQAPDALRLTGYDPATGKDPAHDAFGHDANSHDRPGGQAHDRAASEAQAATRLWFLRVLASADGRAWERLTSVDPRRVPGQDRGMRVSPQRLEQDVQALAGTIGERNLMRGDSLDRAADWVESAFAALGYAAKRQDVKVGRHRSHNVMAELAGTTRPEEIVVVGAHYDSVYGSPGANDNASGVAALLAVMGALAGDRPDRTVRFIAFANEEPPYFHTEAMGSWVAAKESRARDERIVGMLSLETLGYYSDKPGSQRFPLPALAGRFPTTGNFLAMVGNERSGVLLDQAAAAFRAGSPLPLEAAALPAEIPGVGWSDQWSYWQEGYPALMLTDTAPFRYPHYHEATDTPDKVDYGRLAQAADGVVAIVRRLAKV